MMCQNRSFSDIWVLSIDGSPRMVAIEERPQGLPYDMQIIGFLIHGQSTRGFQVSLLQAVSVPEIGFLAISQGTVQTSGKR